jgi:citrate lyase subunit beta / citryl-CoA lyase
MSVDYRLLRSWLFVPGDSERKLARGWDTRADALIIDLEDSVTKERKAVARGIAADAISAVPERRSVVAIRVNAHDTGLIAADIAETFRCRPDAYVLPKAIDPEEVRGVSRQLSGLEVQEGLPIGSTALIPIVAEHPRAVFRLEELCGADSRVAGIMWGTEDLSAALGARRVKDESGTMLDVFRVVRALTLLAGSAAGIAVIDTPVVELGALPVLQRESAEAAAMGFTGKLLIHPSQVDVVNTAFLPSAAEVAYARAVLTAAQGAPGAFRFQDKMIDVPHLKSARRIVALADAHQAGGVARVT